MSEVVTVDTGRLTNRKSLDETKKSCSELINNGLIEIVGKEYMLTAKVYEALKSDVEYTRDKTIQYIKAKNMILEYLQSNDKITSAKIQEMCGFTKQQARTVIDKMRNEELQEIMERLDFIEFRQELLFNNTSIGRSIWKRGVNHYESI